MQFYAWKFNLLCESNFFTRKSKSERIWDYLTTSHAVAVRETDDLLFMAFLWFTLCYPCVFLVLSLCFTCVFFCFPWFSLCFLCVFLVFLCFPCVFLVFYMVLLVLTTDARVQYRKGFSVLLSNFFFAWNYVRILKDPPNFNHGLHSCAVVSQGKSKKDATLDIITDLLVPHYCTKPQPGNISNSNSFLKYFENIEKCWNSPLDPFWSSMA